MMKLIICIIIIIVLLILWKCLMYEPIKSSIDGKNYETVRLFADQGDAANLLAQINKFNIKFIDFLKQKYVNKNKHTPRDKHMKNVACRIITRYRPKNISENFSMYDDDTAYTIGKGKKIKFCLRSKNTKKLHDLNTMKFVSIHEIAHIGTKKYKHPQEFWDNFKELVNDATEAGLYKPINYEIFPKEYCGLNLQHNPFYS